MRFPFLTKTGSIMVGALYDGKRRRGWGVVLTLKASQTRGGGAGGGDWVGISNRYGGWAQRRFKQRNAS